MAETFTTTIMQGDTKNVAGIVVPPEVIAALGTSKKPKVVITLNGYTYRSTVAVMGGMFMIPFNQAHRAASGVNGGDTLDVTLELDTEPRTVDVPDDLKAALAAQAGATEIFDALAHSKRKEFVRQVEEAKAQETRDRRIAGIVAKMTPDS